MLLYLFFNQKSMETAMLRGRVSPHRLMMRARTFLWMSVETDQIHLLFDGPPALKFPPDTFPIVLGSWPIWALRLVAIHFQENAHIPGQTATQKEAKPDKTSLKRRDTRRKNLPPLATKPRGGIPEESIFRLWRPSQEAGYQKNGN